MAKFYGTLQGNRGQATRLGTKDIKATAQSYDGSIIVKMEYDDNENLIVYVSTSDYSSEFGDYRTPYFCGTFEEFKEALELGMNAIKDKRFSGKMPTLAD